MLIGIVVLLLCQLVGEVAVRLLGVDFPGPVVGMVLFLVVLRLRRPPAESTLVRAPELLLRHLQVLYVPAGVGIVLLLDQLREDAIPIAAGLWVSWLIGLVVTALVVNALIKVRRR